MPPFLPLWDKKTEGTPFNPDNNPPTTNSSSGDEAPERQPRPGHDCGTDVSQPLLDIEEAPPRVTGADNSAPKQSISFEGAATEARTAVPSPFTRFLLDALPETQTKGSPKEPTSAIGVTRSQVPTSVLSNSSEPSSPPLMHTARWVPYAVPGRPEGPGLFETSMREDADYSQRFPNAQAAQQPRIRHRRCGTVHNVDPETLFGVPRLHLERADSSALLSSESSTHTDTSPEESPRPQAGGIRGVVTSSLQGPHNESTEALASGASSVYISTPLLQLDDTHVRDHEAGNASSSHSGQPVSTEAQTTVAASAQDGSPLLQPAFEAKSTWPAFGSIPAYSNNSGYLCMPIERSQSEQLPGAAPPNDTQESQETPGSSEKEQATNSRASSDSPPNDWYSESRRGFTECSFTIQCYRVESELDSSSQDSDADGNPARSSAPDESQTHAPLLGTAAPTQASPPSPESPDKEEKAEDGSENQSSKPDKGNSKMPNEKDDELAVGSNDSAETHHGEMTLTNQTYVEDNSPSVTPENLHSRGD
ncbi:hypothetical protein AbraIFM66950_001641 [Aspergillus brasiliensis]|nr:hypothetical protein AbraIFM66950_001641 [Aspergillus brasiliensis]